ncbi:MAG TPA: nucleoside-diphosphate sugar epimerase/dehydratase [Vicinamibacterales bacterium]|nr:nucleoside-diphosphate sugar epimerase/dehydratase [Vicinamibacterales bacterium]
MSYFLYTRFNRVGLDAAAIAISLYAAYLIRFDGDIWPEYIRQLLTVMPYVIGLTLLSFWACGVYRFVWRYVSVREALVILMALSCTTCALIVLRWYLPREWMLWRIPFGVLASQLVIAFLMATGIRLLRRLLYERSAVRRLATPAKRARVLLIGAGNAGVIVARELAGRPDLRMLAVGFLDDDPRKQHTTIHGIKIVGLTTDLARLAAKHRVDQAIITFSNASAREIRRVTQLCQEAGLPVRIVPGIHEILGDRVSITKARDVQIEDLLARDVVTFEGSMPEVERTYRGRVVLVTGAGGSIGSELCRALIALEPRRLVLVDKDENSVFEIHRAMCALMGGPERLQPVIMDIRRRNSLRRLFAETQPEVVLHAAAHKHVPLMEELVAEAVDNNVLGTAGLVEMAMEFKVRSFVMLSTDKAVNPTNVMGATKRLAEMVIQAAAQHSDVRFSCVRFGNVLGSRGSVIPIFKQQIAAGGPVLVTHPDVTRYFMTIPEAAQLVIQAGSLGRHGEIFVLDMGEPVRIMDLARDLVRLSGLREGEDIEIRTTGLRPGEKLYEELLVSEEGTRATKFRKIFIAPSRPVGWDNMRLLLDELEQKVLAGDGEALIPMMTALPIGYEPNRTGHAARPQTGPVFRSVSTDQGTR